MLFLYKFLQLIYYYGVFVSILTMLLKQNHDSLMSAFHFLQRKRALNMDECNNTHFNVKHSMVNTDYLSPMYELHYWQDIQWSAFNSKYFQRFAHWNQIAEVKKSVWSIMFSISHFLWDPSIIRSWMYSFNKYVLLCMEADIDTVEVLDYKMINKTNTPILSVFTIQGVY